MKPNKFLTLRRKKISNKYTEI